MDLFRSGTPTIPDSRAADARAMAADFAGLLGTAEALCRAGRAVDLRGLDDLCGRLCAVALDLPPDEGRAFRPLLATLLGRVDALQTSLAARPAR